MNIFVLSESPREAASYLHDVHLVKMILETCQLLSSAKRVLDGKKMVTHVINVQTNKSRKTTAYELPDPVENKLIYKAGWQNHPCTIWLRQSDKNWRWLHDYLNALLEEYTSRFGKIHTAQASGLAAALTAAPKNILITDTITPFAQAMPDIYKRSDAVEAYRAYYMGAKAFSKSGRFMASYRAPSQPPSWWVNYPTIYSQYL
jgi:hypothetical protein